MFTEKDIRQEMNLLDVRSGIDTSKIPIYISTRMTSTWGKCVYGRAQGQLRVEKLVFADRLLRWATYEHLMEVVRHEYAHAFVLIKYGKADGHSSCWRSWAKHFGGSGKRCNSFPEVDSNGGNKREMRYIVTCADCGTVYKYQRRSKIIQTLEKDPCCSGYKCGRCRGHNFLLKEV